MRVSINEREEVASVTAQTKYFIQGSADECCTLLGLLYEQSLDREDRDNDMLTIDLPAMRLGETARTDDAADNTADNTANDRPDMHRLLNAVHGVYYAAWWLPDRPCGDVVALWTELRDAALFKPGLATAKLGPNRHILPPRIDGEPQLFYQLRRFFMQVLGDDNGLRCQPDDAHTTAKMFMALQRHEHPTMLSLPGDDYYLACFHRRRETKFSS